MTTKSFKDGFGTVVLQPTTVCNLNCSYCYLPERKQKSFIDPKILESVAASLERQRLPVSVLWHGGEPLAAGLERFSTFLKPFRAVMEAGFCQHSLQTNGTLLTDNWCKLIKDHRFRIGVSLDGDARANSARRYWNGAPSWSAAVRGIDLLKQHDIPFGVISVVNHSNLHDPEGLYESIADLKPASISINVEESEGLNVSNPHVDDELVRRFWRGLFEAWTSNPLVPIRQFSDTIQTMEILGGGRRPSFNKRRSLYPTIGVNGDVVLLSPELASTPVSERAEFVVGNVLQRPLEEIVRMGRTRPYVKSFLAGIDACEASCEYFAFCGGGQASNKYFEHGRMDVTETRYCRNSKIAPTDAILGYLEGGVL